MHMHANNFPKWMIESINQVVCVTTGRFFVHKHLMNQ